MERVCLYTIINPKNGIKDYTCDSNYAEQQSKKGYIVYADLINREPKKFCFKGGVSNGII